MSRSAVDEWFRNAELWREEADALRAILLQCEVTETFKWRQACYACDAGNVCIIQRMKGFLALMFFKGALLEDPDGVLEVQGPNSQAGYRLRFTSVRDVTRLRTTIKAYVREAVELERAGRQVGRAEEPDYPEELIDTLDQDPDFRAAFEGLTPGRRRGRQGDARPVVGRREVPDQPPSTRQPACRGLALAILLANANANDYRWGHVSELRRGRREQRWQAGPGADDCDDVGGWPGGGAAGRRR